VPVKHNILLHACLATVRFLHSWAQWVGLTVVSAESTISVDLEVFDYLSWARVLAGCASALSRDSKWALNVLRVG